MRMTRSMAAWMLLIALGLCGCSQPPAAPAAQPGSAADQPQGETGRQPFAGEYGGVTFKPSVEAADFGCEPGAAVEEVPAETVMSPLLFSADFLEPEYTLSGGDLVAVCQDRPIALALEAVGEGRRLRIQRLAGKAVVNTEDPEEAFSTVSVSGKPAVLIQRVRPRPDGAATEHDDWQLVIPEEFGVTVISAVGLTREELLAVAATLS